MCARADGERAILRRERELHVIGGKQAHEIGEQASGHDHRAFALDLRGNDRAQRQLHVRRGQAQRITFPTQLDPREHLYSASGGHRPCDDTKTCSEILSCAGDEQAHR